MLEKKINDKVTEIKMTNPPSRRTPPLWCIPVIGEDKQVVIFWNFNDRRDDEK